MGMDGDGTGRTGSESRTGKRTTAARRTSADQARRGKVQTRHQDQVSSDGKGGEYHARGANQEGSNDKRAEWSGADSEEMEGLAIEEEATTVGWPGWEKETRTATEWGTQESGVGWLQGEVMVGRGENKKYFSTAANKGGARGRHGARQAQGGISRGRRENPARKTSVVRGDDEGHKAYGVVHESPVFGEEGGGGARPTERQNIHWGSRQGLGGGVELPQGTHTSGVTEFPRWDKNPGVTTTGEGTPREDEQGKGGDENLPTTRVTRAQGYGGGND